MNSPRLPQYAVGRWESLWASDPYMSHRILIDLSARKVIAGRYVSDWGNTGAQIFAAGILTVKSNDGESLTTLRSSSFFPCVASF
ncbi:hypothetical protein AB4Y32_37725 [Paraburkholderia phymatum]|uniref:Uncharacterized protein n=1 Tax=Paraburkholderia phymatum TaxID=148447 RepID=A0ACC6UCW6_9BURK